MSSYLHHCKCDYYLVVSGSIPILIQNLLFLVLVLFCFVFSLLYYPPPPFYFILIYFLLSFYLSCFCFFIQSYGECISRRKFTLYENLVMHTKSTQGVLLNLVIYRGRNLTVILTAAAAAAACSKFKGFVLSP